MSAGVRLPDRPLPPAEPRLVPTRELGSIQAELGIRQAPATQLDDYGPPSALSEDLLLRGYGLRRPRPGEDIER